jgi:hypothetical protein
MSICKWRCRAKVVCEKWIELLRNLLPRDCTGGRLLPFDSSNENKQKDQLNRSYHGNRALITRHGADRCQYCQANDEECWLCTARVLTQVTDLGREFARCSVTTRAGGSTVACRQGGCGLPPTSILSRTNELGLLISANMI